MLERFSYRGWNNAYKLSNGIVDLVMTADVGPRILFYGFRNGENLLHEVEEHAGKTGGVEFRLYGGHRLWVSPEVERTYYPDNTPVAVSQHGNAVRFTGQREELPPGTNLQKELEIELATMGSQVRITQRIRNRGLTFDHARAVVSHNDAGLAAARSCHFLRGPRWIRITICRWERSASGLLRTLPIRAGSSAHPISSCNTLANSQARFKEQMGGIYNSAGWGAYFSRVISL